MPSCIVLLPFPLTEKIPKIEVPIPRARTASGKSTRQFQTWRPPKSWPQQGLLHKIQTNPPLFRTVPHIIPNQIRNNWHFWDHPPIFFWIFPTKSAPTSAALV